MWEVRQRIYGANVISHERSVVGQAKCWGLWSGGWVWRRDCGISYNTIAKQSIYTTARMSGCRFALFGICSAPRNIWVTRKKKWAKRKAYKKHQQPSYSIVEKIAPFRFNEREQKKIYIRVGRFVDVAVPIIKASMNENWFMMKR